MLFTSLYFSDPSSSDLFFFSSLLFSLGCHVHKLLLHICLQPRQHGLRQAIAIQHRITISNFNHLQFHSQLKFHSPNFKPFLSPPPPTPPNPSTTSQLLFTKTSTHIHRLVHSYITLFMLHRKCNSHLILL